ncbi:multicopper oxidase-domain-containing protein [Chytridium lagenaria]|nr:multicopper oxidase-domain-containing protein [Chytridium lagenaria]
MITRNRQRNSKGEIAFAYTVIRFVADNPGVWFFHCHIEWHIQAGLAMAFVEASGKEFLTLRLVCEGD